MVLEHESNYFKNEFFDEEFGHAPFKKEVCLGIFCPDDTIGDILADNFCDMGLLVFEQRNENPTKPFCNFDFEEYEDYISFFLYIDKAEIMSFSIPVEQNEEKLKESVMPVFRNFWETHFEEIMEVRRYNRGIVEKLSQKNSAYAFRLLYIYYRKIEMDSTNRKFFWLKKWATKSNMGMKELLKFYRADHKHEMTKKIAWLIRRGCDWKDF